MTRLFQYLLFPFAVLFDLITRLRNLLFDMGILTSVRFDTPVISVGNLSYGGTGKTPHVEYLVRLLAGKNSIAILSRGYGRKSRGFVLATRHADVAHIGDEPLQYFQKFENIRVAVDEKRRRGIRMLEEKFPETDVILLDDAFQHRYVKPGLSILLTDYHHLYTDDFLIPSGTLREARSGAKRADIIVVTKTPRILSPITRRRIMEDLRHCPHQQVCFSYITYCEPVPVFTQPGFTLPSKITNILMFTGIANDYPLREHLERMCSELIVMKFPDHHPYNRKDIDAIFQKFNDLPTQKKILVTTEKDVMRLKVPELIGYVKNLPLFCVPMEVDFHGSDKEIVERKVIDYVKKGKRND
jgi:tetraacyldisaccharide 4'-kinase